MSLYFGSFSSNIPSMIDRVELLEQVQYGLKRNPVTAILGPRQCGKTTLGREIGRQEKAAYFDLEDPNDHQIHADRDAGLEAGAALGSLSGQNQLPDG
jgi:predicted AAA+ superfamily ATPase